MMGKQAEETAAMIGHLTQLSDKSKGVNKQY